MLTAKLNFVLHLLLLIFLFFFASVYKACNQLDQDALLSLNFKTSSAPLNWSSSIDCCLWEGIKCDASGCVSHLLLPWRGLRGTISPSIGNLTHLSHLNLSHNSLYSPLVKGSFQSLLRLQTLDLSYNYLSGEFPSFVSSSYIKIVDLSSNQFHGRIPSSFFQIARSLMSFNISNNSFTGLIPSFSEVDSACSLSLLDFSNNDFNGQVPPGLGNCSNLQTFRAGFNNLHGSIPNDIYLATSLEEISLPVNHLSGPISDGIVNLSDLTVLELYSNQLNGSIPGDIGKLTNLKHLLLHINNMSGSLPSSMENCINLITLSLRFNNFEGDLSPFNFSMLLQLRTLDLGNNTFTSSLPSTLNSCKSLTALRLSNNQLEGQISPNIVVLKSLTFLILSGNRLTNITGAIKILMGCKNLSVLILSESFIYEAMPDEHHITFSNGFENLQILGLNGCLLNGQVPTWIGKLKKLQVLALSRNRITGSIPGWLGTLPNLFFIDLSNNFISGEFPKELSGLSMLASEQAQNQVDMSYLKLPLFFRNNNFYGLQYNRLSNLPPAIILANNSLSGSIPIEIGRLKFLHVLDLSHNNFSGNIPDQLSQMTNLERLHLSGNHLSGEIPISLKVLHFLSSFNVADNDLQGPIPSGGQFDTFPSSSFEGNPGLCGAIVQSPCTIHQGTTILPPPKESSNEELRYGLIAGGSFGMIIGFTIGIPLPLRKLKFLHHSRYGRRHGWGRRMRELAITTR